MTMYAPRVIEDFAAGQVFHTGHYVLDEQSLLHFSNAYDPQPLHTDADFAKEGPFGALIASGIQTIAISIRLFVEMGMFNGTCLAGPSMDNVRFIRPVYIGDCLRCTVTVLEARLSSKDPGKGVLRTHYEMFNQNDLVVLSHEITTMVKSKKNQPKVLNHVLLRHSK